eukprot:351270-Chlamydomonas_euryale.AAC.3
MQQVWDSLAAHSHRHAREVAHIYCRPRLACISCWLVNFKIEQICLTCLDGSKVEADKHICIRRPTKPYMSQNCCAWPVSCPLPNQPAGHRMHTDTQDNDDKSRCPRSDQNKS